MKKLSIMVLGVLTALALALPVLAQEYPTFDGPVTVSDSTPNAGDTVTVSGSGFEAGATIELWFRSDPVKLGETTADAAGEFEAEVTIPADAAAGVHHIEATGPAAGGGTLVLGTQVTVAGDLANTGNSLPAGIVVAAAIIGLAGVAALLAGRTARAN